jgi:hypothetical protein
VLSLQQTSTHTLLRHCDFARKNVIHVLAPKQHPASFSSSFHPTAVHVLTHSITGRNTSSLLDGDSTNQDKRGSAHTLRSKRFFPQNRNRTIIFEHD